MKVKDIMTIEVVACEKDTSVKDVVSKLIDNNLTGIPVMEKGEMVGIITESDLIMQKATIHMPAYIQLLNSFLYLEDPDDVGDELKKILATKASGLMTEDVVSVSPEDDVSDLATIIEEEHINPVPVLKDKKLVGIVARSDIVKLLAKE